MADLPQIPGYLALRQGADWASAIRGQTVFFGYTPGAITVDSPDAPNSVAVSTTPSAKSRPPVNSATLTLEGYPDLVLAGNRFSALFLSASAVEKFVLPYYVSAAGRFAYEVLHAINHVFYNYPDGAPACGLAFGYASEPILGPKQLLDTLYVIACTGTPGSPDAALTCTSVGSLLAGLGPVTTQTPPPSPPAAPLCGPVSPRSTEPTLVDSQGAREVAEFVSGLQGREVSVYGVQVPGGLEATLTPEAVSGGVLLFNAEGGEQRPGRPQPTVTLDVPGTDNDPLTGPSDAPENVPDAVFWTDAAVELLMVPYYASVEGHFAPWYLMTLLGKWAGLIPTDVLDAVEIAAQLAEDGARLLLEGPVGMVKTVERWLDGNPPEALVDSRVYAIIHLPRSEWVDERTGLESILLENRTYFLTPGRAYPLVGRGRRLGRSRRIRG
jgi:hypothetical protein